MRVHLLVAGIDTAPCDTNLWFLSRMLAKDELITLLQSCAEILRSEKSKKMKRACVQMDDVLTRLKQLDGER